MNGNKAAKKYSACAKEKHEQTNVRMNVTAQKTGLIQLHSY